MNEPCWFCGAAGERSRAAVVTMSRDVAMMDAVHYRKTTWKQTEVAVPRCASCATRHRRSRLVRSTVMTVVFVGALAFAWKLCPTHNVGDRGIYLFGGACIGWFVGFVLAWLAGPVAFARAGKPEKFGWEAPVVMRMKADGWKVGTPRGEHHELTSPV